MTEFQINSPYVGLWDIEDSSIPPDMLKELCIDNTGLLLKITTPRLLYRKQKAEVLSFGQENNTFAAMVSISITGRGITQSFPVAITSEEAAILNSIVDLAFNKPNLILSDGRIPFELRWAPYNIISRGIQYVESNKAFFLNQEQNILSQMNPAYLANLQRQGIGLDAISPSGNLSCPNCGTIYTSEQRFCVNCGIKLS